MIKSVLSVRRESSHWSNIRPEASGEKTIINDGMSSIQEHTGTDCSLELSVRVAEH